MPASSYGRSLPVFPLRSCGISEYFGMSAGRLTSGREQCSPKAF